MAARRLTQTLWRRRARELMYEKRNPKPPTHDPPTMLQVTMSDIRGVRAAAFALPDRVKAIALMCAAVTLFSCLDASAKYLIAHSNLPTAEVVWMRFVGQVLLMAAILGPWTIPSLLKTQRLGLQALRSLLMVATTACNFVAVQYLRLDQTVSIAFLAPLVVAALAGPILGEYVGWRRALAIAVGFLGILVVVRPGVADVHWAFAVSFAGMLAYAAFMIVTRLLSDYDTPLVTLFYALIAGAVGGAFVAIPEWVWPSDAWQWLALLSLGAFGGFGHYLLILAYRLAPASAVSPFLYFQILSMVGLGYLLFGDTPDLWSLVGSAIIVASGVYLVHRERKAGVTPPTPAE
ncbi:MAG: DMT family transporter [Hyphomicrobium sp.]